MSNDKLRKVKTQPTEEELKERESYLRQKKDMILDHISLGIDRDRAILMSGLSTDDITLISKDDEFEYEMNKAEYQSELSLRKKYKDTVDSAALARYDYAGVRGLLLDLHPDAFGDNRDETQIHIYIPDNGRNNRK
ncbi:MAG: hypothetical protein A4E71_02653 [Smithella sp. PtaU1.Bin162]|nr:MAG: hypothetical protein A4E71_02653 [Smithella sp. PtaU1.Bin162]